MPPETFETVRRVVEEDLGRPLEDVAAAVVVAKNCRRVSMVELRTWSFRGKGRAGGPAAGVGDEVREELVRLRTKSLVNVENK